MGAPPGLPRGQGPRSTLRKLVFLRSAPRAGYIVLLRWTGEVAADLLPLASGLGAAVSPCFPPAGERLEAAREWGWRGDGAGGVCLLPLPEWPCPWAPKPKAPLGGWARAGGARFFQSWAEVKEKQEVSECRGKGERKERVMVQK